MAYSGWVLKTGAALGADQAFARGAADANGLVELCLPWASYEKEWVQTLSWKSNVKLNILSDRDTEAYASVVKYHPAPDKLTRGAKALHARNFLILRDVSFVIAFTAGKTTGGTWQGIRIAESLGIQVLKA